LELVRVNPTPARTCGNHADYEGQIPMKRILTLGAALLASTAAHAYSITINTAPASGYDFFAPFVGESGNWAATPDLFFSGDGVVRAANVSIPGVTVAVGGEAYMSVFGSETLYIHSPRTSFALNWGSADDYNDLWLGGTHITGETIRSFLGGRDNAWVDISGVTPFTEATFISTSPAFEFNLPGPAGAATPELSTWMMGLIGFGFIGFSIFRQRLATVSRWPV